jgi:8-oxo-dGTP pyrophosphatase MutT (NUDIX family)
VDEIVRRLSAGTPGRRSAPRAPEAGEDWPRGDHDLNPDFYEPGRALTEAAVLVPIVTRGEGPTVLLTQRTDHLNDHAGQISFPGGRLDPGDANARAAALRETEEEIGLVAPPFALTLDSFEVAEAFEVPLAFFLDSANRKTDSRLYQGKERHFFAFPYGERYIWGATAGMLVNLAEVLGAPC